MLAKWSNTYVQSHYSTWTRVELRAWYKKRPEVPMSVDCFDSHYNHQLELIVPTQPYPLTTELTSVDWIFYEVDFIPQLLGICLTSGTYRVISAIGGRNTIPREERTQIFVTEERRWRKYNKWSSQIHPNRCIRWACLETSWTTGQVCDLFTSKRT